MHRIPPHHARSDQPVARRAFLADLGRVTLGAVVLGPVLTACSPGGDDDADGGTPGDADEDASNGSDGSSAETAAGPVDAGTAEGELAWERASYGFVSAYVLVRDGEAMVFDTGTSDGGVEPIAGALEAAGVGWEAVAHIVASHSHGDHVGGLEAVAEQAPDAVLYASTPDLDGFRDRVESAQEVGDADRVLGVRVVGTPGHTLGHISAYDEDSGLLLSGDAIVRDREIGGTTGEGIEASPPDFTADMDQAIASVGVLADLQPATILFGHGDPLSEGAATMLADYAEAL